MATTLEPMLPATSPVPLEAGICEQDDGLSDFVELRPRLFGIAYRMLGTVSEADDIVQDVWMRWQCTNRSLVEHPPAFLATTTAHLCINLLQSAKSRHETCLETSFLEPVDPRSDPGKHVERRESLRQAILLILKKLSPAERAAYILREAFDYSYRQIADLLQIEVANSRQLVSRARKHAAQGRHAPVSIDALRRLHEAFVTASQGGNMTVLEDLLLEDDSDSGETVRSPRFAMSLHASSEVEAALGEPSFGLGGAGETRSV